VERNIRSAVGNKTIIDKAGFGAMAAWITTDNISKIKK